MTFATWYLFHVNIYREFDIYLLSKKHRLTRECALPGQKVRTETMANQKSVLKLDDPGNFNCFFPVKAEINAF